MREAQLHSSFLEITLPDTLEERERSSVVSFFHRSLYAVQLVLGDDAFVRACWLSADWTATFLAILTNNVEREN